MSYVHKIYLLKETQGHSASKLDNGLVPSRQKGYREEDSDIKKCQETHSVSKKEGQGEWKENTEGAVRTVA